jgi:DNA-binding transcriptional LysR family regulator
MDLTRLRHIVAVARNQSFSRAAEEEGITQPALSRSIASFEQRHGVILFDRGRGGVYPTAAGIQVVEQAKILLAAASDLERNLKLYPGGGAGRIAFGLGPLLAALFLPRVGSALLRAYPGIQIKTLVRPPDQLISELLSDQIEVILGNSWNLGRVPGTELIRLGSLKLAAVARSGHPLEKAERITSADMQPYPAANAVELPTFGAEGNAGGFICDNFHILRETVLQSDCVWISSPAFLAADLREGRMVQLDIADLSADDSDVCLLVKRDRTRSPGATAITSEVQAMLRDCTAPQIAK